MHQRSHRLLPGRAAGSSEQFNASVAAIASTSPPPSTPRAAAHEPGGTGQGRPAAATQYQDHNRDGHRDTSSGTSSHLAKISVVRHRGDHHDAHAGPRAADICITITIHRARRLWYSGPSQQSEPGERDDRCRRDVAVQKAISAQLRRR